MRRAAAEKIIDETGRRRVNFCLFKKGEKAKKRNGTRMSKKIPFVFRIAFRGFNENREVRMAARRYM
ncbi:MAG TPA: hypothetical protein PKU94_00035 [Candidatus Hydrothermia bacterium]|nr:hypothetical protein [Candidatus Hydrothermia bacterium]HOK23594.1 hypothetical protein [Candidatus Hydrothermia bacterium]HOL24356.1 hypothetical protein [Candidatus Hydrothermia bacterium]HOP31763.1 hypothetical protein [Candidatus Hydrothermia bacterium]HPO79335.1 hypothetical protein [Candidatus Hydrothermia bacterium]